MSTHLDLRLDPQVKLQDRRRGHRFQAPKADLKKVPGLYETESTPLAEKIVHLHYFTGAADWYIVEIDPETQKAFGYADLGYGGEWGYMDLTEMATVSSNYLGIERDKWWTPVAAGTIEKVGA